MASASTPKLAAAVTNAGGLGSLGCAMMSADENSPDFFFMWVGQSVALSKSLPAKELVEVLVEETDEALARLAR